MFTNNVTYTKFFINFMLIFLVLFTFSFRSSNPADFNPWMIIAFGMLLNCINAYCLGVNDGKKQTK